MTQRFQIYVVSKKDKTFFNAGVERATSARAAVNQAKRTDSSLFKYRDKGRFTIKAEPIK